MSTIRSELLGEAPGILVLSLPPMVVDESADAIREEVSRRLPNAIGTGLVLDCTAVELINSIGITCLLQVQDHCRRMKAPMLLAGVPGAIQTFLKQLKLDRRFTIEASVDDAVNRIASSAA